MGKGTNQARRPQAQEYAEKRMKERMIVFLTDEVRDPNEIVCSPDIAQYLRTKHDEYQRKQMQHIVTAVSQILDAMFSSLHQTNIKKSFFKKKDLIKCKEESDDEDQQSDSEANSKPIYDSDGNELIEHKSKNTMNNMLPLNVKAAEEKEKQETLLGKRTKREGDEDKEEQTTDDKSQVKKRRKVPASYSQHLADQKQSQQAEEMLNKLKVEPTIKFDDLGGLDETIKQLREMIEWPLIYDNIFNWLGVKPPRGILISGPPGTGKTQLALAVAGENPDIPVYKLNAPEVVSGLSGQSEEKIRQMFQGVREKAPAVVFIDELDSIAGKREHAGKDMEVRIVAQLASCLDDLDQAGEQVIVIGVTSRPETIDQGLRRAGRFDREITIGVPNEEARIDIMKKLTKDLRLQENFPFEELVKCTPGYVGADLQTLCKEASIIAVKRIVESTGKDIEGDDDKSIDLEQFYIEVSDFQLASKRVKPSAQREGFSTVPNTSWTDVGALTAVREELVMSIVEPILNPERFKMIGLSAPAGVLLYGPPGCGKTLVARAVSNESKANFISIKGPELLNKYVGESEKAVRQLFKRANSSAPCVIFFDELDSLCPKRGSENNSSSERVVNQLLTEMDGLDERRGVFVIAATNRPDIIDPAMLRPGRLDKLLYVPLPSKEDRVSILNTVCRKVPLADDVDLTQIAHDQHCEGYSGADLSALVREAQMCTLKAVIAKEGKEEGTKTASTEKVLVSMQDFQIALTQVFPSVSKRDEQSYKALEGSLRKTRASISQNPSQALPENKAKVDTNLKKPTPMKF